MARIALVGEPHPSVAAHQAIPLALARAAARAEIDLRWSWVETASLGAEPARALEPFQGLWCVPGSPYANTAGVLAAIRHARRRGLPYLGTCGGFQHALLEYAEDCWGVERPAHAELDPRAPDPLIAPLSCALVEAAGGIRLVPGSRLAAIYGAERAEERYRCRYGLSPRYARRLETGPLCVAARDEAGDVRAVELGGHPFFFATLFQPERAELEGRLHPLIAAFARAASGAA
jgi:CTP synthase (UTP-ammonia lyase)